MNVWLFASVTAPVLLIFHMLWLGSLGNPGPELSKAEMKRHIVWRSFYLNPDDPRAWVPKTWGYGWTVNFRTMTQVYVFATLIAITLGSAVMMSWCAIEAAG